MRQWRQSFSETGLDGLGGEPGRSRTYGQDLVARIVSMTLSRPPRGAPYSSTRTLATRLEISHETVHRIWHGHPLQPHRAGTFKFSEDPHLEQVTDVVGLYPHPPEKAVVLSVDEKTQIQALDRTKPLLPMRPGQIERRSHDYVRHGTTTLFAAVDVATGRVTGHCSARRQRQDLLRLVWLVARSYPLGQVHRVLDN